MDNDESTKGCNEPLCFCLLGGEECDYEPEWEEDGPGFEPGPPEA